MKKQVIAFVFINAFFLFFGFGVKQKNPEELFLSDKNFQYLQDYKKQFGEDEITHVSNAISDTRNLLEAKVLEINGEFVNIDRLLPNHAVFTLPQNLSDEEKFDFFQSAAQLDPKMSFAGPTFTNAHLAGMSDKIQNVFFPIIFSILFLSIFFIFRNLTITFYLFLTSFVGVSVGLAVVKIFFSYSTILTSITPLVSFVLTMANQMHVVFGIHTYKSKSEFLRKKLQPILIMMATTVIGFAGLIFSDLLSIRQFGIATTITLILTWTLNLIFLSNFNLEFILPKKRYNFQFKRPVNRPVIGLIICGFLLILGIYSLKKMPTLVEAIFFFPENHPVRTGHHIIEKELGGTPQFDLAITKMDSSEFSHNDYLILDQFEKLLKSNKTSFHLLSLNELIKTANKVYSGLEELPDNEGAFLVLKGKIPEILRKTILSPHAYKISFLSPPLTNENRNLELEKLTLYLKQLPKGFSGKISGLNYLLLDSQEQLVKTLLSSLMGSFLLIAFIFALFSRNIKEILLFSLISLSSIFGGLFLMHLFGFSLNVSSIMVLSISIGLIDDSTIHLLYAQKHGENPERIQQSCILPMMYSNLILFICFLLLGFESFIPIKEFAWGLVLMLGMGFSLDLFILPMFNKKLT